MLTGISGSKQVRSWSQASSSGVLPSEAEASTAATVSPIASASLPSMRARNPTGVMTV